MQYHPALDVSVILPFGDDEEVIGTACQRVAQHLGALGLTYEIIAVDEDSGDNCHAILGLLRGALPELQVLCAAGAGRGFAAGAQAARGRTLWLLEPRSAIRSLAPFGRAHGRVSGGELDLVLVRGRFVVAKRARGIGFIEGLSGRGPLFERRVLRRAQRRNLRTEAYEIGGMKPSGRLGHRLRWRLALALGAAHRY